MRVFLLLAAAVLLGAQSEPGPWDANDLVTPAALAAGISASHAPVIVMAGPRVIYDGAHVRGAIFAGPAGTPEGLTRLRAELAKLNKTEPVLLYCGCCPMNVCPNIRPAYRAAREMGFRTIRVLDLPSSLRADWTEKNYPVERGPAQ